jgi:hypothetical protein
MTIAIIKDHIELKSLTERPPTLGQRLVQKTKSGEGQSMMHLEGGHRLAALEEMRKDWNDEIEEAEKYLAEGGLSDDNRMEISEKKSKLEDRVKHIGLLMGC